MNTNNIIYKVVVLAMVFGLLGAPVAMAEDREDGPLYNITYSPQQEDEAHATAALSEEEQPVTIRDLSVDFTGPQWERVPGKND